MQSLLSSSVASYHFAVWKIDWPSVSASNLILLSSPATPLKPILLHTSRPSAAPRTNPRSCCRCSSSRQSSRRSPCASRWPSPPVASSAPRRPCASRVPAVRSKRLVVNPIGVIQRSRASNEPFDTHPEPLLPFRRHEALLLLGLGRGRLQASPHLGLLLFALLALLPVILTVQVRVTRSGTVSAWYEASFCQSGSSRNKLVAYLAHPACCSNQFQDSHLSTGGTGGTTTRAVLTACSSTNQVSRFKQNGPNGVLWRWLCFLKKGEQDSADEDEPLIHLSGRSRRGRCAKRRGMERVEAVIKLSGLICGRDDCSGCRACLIDTGGLKSTARRSLTAHLALSSRPIVVGSELSCGVVVYLAPSANSR